MGMVAPFENFVAMQYLVANIESDGHLQGRNLNDDGCECSECLGICENCGELLNVCKADIHCNNYAGN